MAQIIDPIPSKNSDKILCCYVNATSKIQIARITNVPNWYFERVVFPGQRLMFEAVPEALLEIHTGMMASAILSDTIPCDRLALDENPQPLVEDAEVETAHSALEMSASAESQVTTSTSMASTSMASTSMASASMASLSMSSMSVSAEIGRIA